MPDHEGESPGGLAHLVQVEEGVKVPGADEDAEEGDGEPSVRLGREEEGGVGQEHVDALHVVEVRTPHPLNVLVHCHCPASGLSILLVGKYLEQKKNIILVSLGITGQKNGVKIVTLFESLCLAVRGAIISILSTSSAP